VGGRLPVKGTPRKKLVSDQGYATQWTQSRELSELRVEALVLIRRTVRKWISPSFLGLVVFPPYGRPSGRCA